MSHPVDVRFGIKILEDNGAHVRFVLFAATGGEYLGRCGLNTMRAAEFSALQQALTPHLTDRSDPGNTNPLRDAA